MPIGGYHELELPNNKEYHPGALKLNTGRNALEYILKTQRYKKVYLPYFTCDVMFEPIQKLGINYEFYEIDKNFMPLFDFCRINEKEVFIYTNYFGICESQVKTIGSKCKNLIIDNAQAFFSSPRENFDMFFSPRKFFGVSDGAYLYTDKSMEIDYEQDISYSRFDHLLGRIDKGSEVFYNSFKKNNQELSGQSIKKMSNLTHRILTSIDYDNVRQKRINNFNYLHNRLRSTNILNVDLDSDDVPLVYPYLIGDGNVLKKKLINEKIFVATYWPNVLNWVSKNAFEYFLADNLICLPIDQRYSNNEMSFIISKLEESKYL